MLFLTLSNVDIQFPKKKLTWRSYTITKALPTTKQVEYINKKEFAGAAIDENVEAFVVHVTSLSLSSMSIHPAKEAQIEEKTLVLPEITDFNHHVIKLQDGQEPPYGLIYSLQLIELETLETYIKTNLVNGFNRLFKPPASVFNLFVQKPNGSLYLFINYQGLNNLTIKN